MDGYVLPLLGDRPLADVRTKDLRALTAVLLDRGLSVKYVKNIVAGSFRAMVRDWCIDADDAPNPFDRLPRGFWPKVTTPPPDPFTAEERDAICDWFAGHHWHVHAARATTGHPRVRLHLPYAAMIHLLAWTGMRPSEASGLQWHDVDVAKGIVLVRRSRHLGELAAPKTAAAGRVVHLVPETIAWLRRIQPLHVRPTDFVFLNVDGRPVDQRKLAERFHDCLRALGIRVRGLYCLKDTYVTLALAQDVRDDWIETQTGVALSTLKKHYGTYDAVRDSDAQIGRLTGGESEHRSVDKNPR
jgi:integrase